MRRHHPSILKSRPRTPESGIRTWREGWGAGLLSSRIYHPCGIPELLFIGHLLWAQHYPKHCPLRVYLILHTTLQILIIPVWMMRKMKLGEMEQGQSHRQCKSRSQALSSQDLSSVMLSVPSQPATENMQQHMLQGEERENLEIPSKSDLGSFYLSFYLSIFPISDFKLYFLVVFCFA